MMGTSHLSYSQQPMVARNLLIHHPWLSELTYRLKGTYHYQLNTHHILSHIMSEGYNIIANRTPLESPDQYDVNEVVDDIVTCLSSNEVTQVTHEFVQVALMSMIDTWDFNLNERYNIFSISSFIFVDDEHVIIR